MFATIRVANCQEATLETLNGSYGSTHVRVDLTGFTESIGAITMRIGFDPNVVSFTGISSGAITNGINANVIGNEIVIAWSNPDAILINGTAFDLDFDYTGGSCSLTFNEGCEISDGAGSLIATTFTNGAINQPSGATATIGNQDGVLSVVNELPISFAGFLVTPNSEKVGAITLNIGYDVSKLQFVGIAGLPGAIANDLSGVIHVLWSSATPIDLNATNMRLQFAYLGGYSAVHFVGTNSISKANGTQIVVDFVDGEITQAPTSAKVIIDSVVGLIGGITEVPLMFSGFSQDQGSLNMHIAYNTGALNFVGTSGLSGVNVNAENGIITLAWSNVSGMMISNLKLLFNYLGGSSNLEFTGLNQITDNSGLEMPVTYGDGLVIQGSTQVDVSLEIVNLTPDSDIVLVPINLSGASSVHAATMYINFDHSKLTYVGVENALSGVVANQDAVTKTIILTWADGNNSITSLSNKFLDLKFIFTGGSGNCDVPVYFTTFNSNTSSLADNGGGTVIANWSNGNVNFKLLNLKLFLEGLYNPVGMMRQAQNAYGPQWSTGVADKIGVELHSASDYGTILYTSPLIDLSTSGIATTAIPCNFNGSYFITIKNRNTIETTTSTPISFSGCTISYDFSLGVSQAYGDNMKDIGGVSVLYCGDFTSAATPYPLSPIQDGVIDDSDYYDAYYSSLNSDSGYLPQDIDGNGQVSIEDVLMIFDNYAAGITSILP